MLKKSNMLMLFNILIYLVYNQIRAIITITNMFSMYYKDSVINLIVLLVWLIIKNNFIKLVLKLKFKFGW